MGIKKACVDHEGNVFKSKTEMAKYYGISPQAFNARIKAKWTLKDALTVGANCDAEDRTGLDGTVYASVLAMAKAYGISESTYRSRRNRGMSKEEALTGIAKRFDSDATAERLEKVMVKKNEQAARANRRAEAKTKTDSEVDGKNGEKKAVTIDDSYIVNSIVDHHGKSYKSYQEMADAYSIPYYRLMARLREGWTVEKALTTAARTSEEERTDHLGNIYKTKKAMVEAYGLQYEEYRNRRRNGMSKEKALTTK